MIEFCLLVVDVVVVAGVILKLAYLLYSVGFLLRYPATLYSTPVLKCWERAPKSQVLCT